MVTALPTRDNDGVVPPLAAIVADAVAATSAKAAEAVTAKRAPLRRLDLFLDVLVLESCSAGRPVT
jgi:hypothetical protein